MIPIVPMTLSISTRDQGVDLNVALGTGPRAARRGRPSVSSTVEKGQSESPHAITYYPKL